VADSDADLPRLAAVVERQRRELALARADAGAAEVIAMARGVLIERHGWSPAHAARELADMAGAAGMPLTEMAAAVLRQEPPAPARTGPQDTDGPQAPRSVPDALISPPQPGAGQQPGAVRPGAGEWLEPGQPLGAADDPLALAGAVRARDGHELVSALAGQLAERFGVTAVAVWLLDADGALDLLGASGLGGTDSSRWRRLPPQLDCLEQRVAGGGADLWWVPGPPPADPPPAAPQPAPPSQPAPPAQLAPWGRQAPRAVVALPDRAGLGPALGVVEAWWPRPPADFARGGRDRMAAAIAGFAEVLGARLSYAPLGSVSPSPAVFAALGEITDSALLVRPLRDAAGTVTDFGIVSVSPRYADPAGRTGPELAALTGLTLLEAYPSSVTGDGLFARAERVLTSGRSEHVPGPLATALSGAPEDAIALADLHAVPFFAGVLFTWRAPGEAEHLAELLDHAQRLGSIGGWEERLAAGTVHWTASAFALFGLDPDQVAPIPVADLHSFVIAADRAPVRRFQDALLRRREPAVAVFRIVRPGDTVIRQIRVFAEPVVAGGDLVALRGAFQDVSSQYHTQVALAATRDQLADSEQRAAQEHLLALRLQRAIMPPDEAPVNVAWADVAVRYRPAEAGHLVGGDWYDALLLPGEDLLLVVGDITGHGIDAVTGMVAARNALRGLAATGAGPGELLRHLNYAACHLTERIAGTVICGQYSPRTQVLRWARAGHLPPVLVRGSAARTLPLPEGVLLGLDPKAEYEEASCQLRADDTLLLYTDGLIERRTGSISDALRQFTMTAAPGGPDAAAHADRILRSALSDTGDDACLVAVRIR
jgi:hypothetical protein